jgi:hypothetical protein
LVQTEALGFEMDLFQSQRLFIGGKVVSLRPKSIHKQISGK